MAERTTRRRAEDAGVAEAGATPTALRRTLLRVTAGSLDSVLAVAAPRSGKIGPCSVERPSRLTSSSQYRPEPPPLLAVSSHWYERPVLRAVPWPAKSAEPAISEGVTLILEPSAASRKSRKPRLSTSYEVCQLRSVPRAVEDAEYSRMWARVGENGRRSSAQMVQDVEPLTVHWKVVVSSSEGWVLPPA